MSGFKTPSPLCVSREPFALDTGTLALTLSMPPGPLDAFALARAGLAPCTPGSATLGILEPFPDHGIQLRRC